MVSTDDGDDSDPPLARSVRVLYLYFLAPAVAQFPTQVNRVFIFTEILWECEALLSHWPATGPAQITEKPGV